MKNGNKKNVQLSEELAEIRRQLAEQQKSQAEHKIAEQALRESRQLLRLVLDAIPVRIFWKDIDLKYLGCNQVFASDAGLDSPAAIVGLSDYDMGWKEQADQYRADDLSVISSGMSRLDYEEPQTTPEGGLIWLRTSKIPLLDAEGRIKGVLGTYEDITDRKHTEARLDESQRHFADIINFLPDATFVINKEGEVTSWNRALENISGIPAETMLGKGNYEHALPFYGRRRPMIADLIISPDDDMEKQYSFIRKEKGIHMAETYVPSLGGKERFLSVRATPMYNSKGEMVGAIESFRDLTEKKMLEKALAEEHRTLSSVLDGSPVSAFVIDRDCWVTGWNMVNEFFTGISKEDVIGKPLDLSPLFKGKASPSLAELVLEMTDEEIIERFGHKGVRKSAIHPQAFESIGSIWINGKEHIMAVQATRLRDVTGNIIGAIQCAQDITEQKKAEETQRKREKLTALIETAGMICHEMNQPLQAILGQAQLLDITLQEGDHRKNRLRTIMEQTERMAGITKSLMTITRYDLKSYIGETKIIDLDKSTH